MIPFLLGLFEFFNRDIAGLHKAVLVLLGDLQQARVVLMALAHRLRNKYAPQADSVIGSACSIEHLEIDLVVAFEYREQVALGIELNGKRGRRRAAWGRNKYRALLSPRPRCVGQPVVEIASEYFGEGRRGKILPEEDRVVHVLHPLAEEANFFPLVQRGFRFVRFGRELKLVNLAEEPFDLREARRAVAFHRPVELLFSA